ncbi:MAG: tRNA (adenine-N1)-methyltransferase [Thermoplasmata archaeon]|nr:tRNA (adenine-N1)-methyltransferase [Thermoplasmata archaeon]
MYVLIDDKGRKRFVQGSDEDKEFVIDKNKLEASLGRPIKIGGKRFLVLEASLLDIIESIERKAQIVLPKDSAIVIFNLALKSGDVVVEGGIGSGALTIALSHFVGTEGNVVSYELREDFAGIARKNLERAGFEKRVQIKIADITKDIEEKDVDSVVLDLPKPWEAVENAHKALKPGGHFCSLSPNSSQVTKTVDELRRLDFAEVNTLESMQRTMLVQDGWMRPDKMLAHTCYITFARKTVEGFN